MAGDEVVARSASRDKEVPRSAVEDKVAARSTTEEDVGVDLAPRIRGPHMPPIWCHQGRGGGPMRRRSRRGGQICHRGRGGVRIHRQGRGIRAVDGSVLLEELRYPNTPR